MTQETPDSYLHNIGIFGWKKPERVILAAILAKLPLLLIGRHGVNKTEGIKRISRAVWGGAPGYSFQGYDTPLLATDDLLGFPNPASLAKGQMEYLPTPLSIWKHTVVLFDELNRANPMISSKLMEIIRTRKVMGLPTKLRFCFSAINPPSDYDALPLPLALASRFVCIHIPDMNEGLVPDDLDAILAPPDQNKIKSALELRKLIKKASQVKIDKATVTTLKNTILTLYKTTLPLLVISPRQFVYMLALLKAMCQLRSCGYVFSAAEVTLTLMSVLPETFDIVSAQVQTKKIRKIIRQQVVKMMALLDMETAPASGLVYLCSAPIDDPLGWSNNIIQAASKLKDPEEGILKSIKTIKDRGDVGKDLLNSILMGLVSIGISKDTKFMSKKLTHTGLQSIISRFLNP